MTVAEAWLTLLAIFLLRRGGETRSGKVAIVLLLGMIGKDIVRLAERRIVPVSKSVCARDVLGHLELANDMLRIRDLGRFTLAPHDILSNFGDLHGFQQLQGFAAGVASTLLRHEYHTRRTQTLFGVTHHVGKRPGSIDDTLLRKYPSGIGLYRKASALPLAWLVHSMVAVPDEVTLRAMIQNPDLDIAHTALVLNGPIPKVEACRGAESVDFARARPGRIRIVVTAQCRGVVIVSQSNYIGWNATVDGVGAPIIEAFGTFPAVVVDAGVHEIVLNYAPKSFQSGAIVSMLGLLLFVVSLLFAPPLVRV
ncbi:MAG: hypothetical protein HY820_36395 [Acidobacteria bacterium]|nr:hypothetical protein [Acidobacteriota bacterium]